ncbi:MAG: trypsin-like peptidase domain-containing protein [Alphaproteobacteria bacterium]|nr:trypsin-like peptidase domain-containing protein [Alphaproteobacteria bacterium]
MKKSMLLLLIVFSIAACLPTTYRYNNQSYATREAALSNARADLNINIAAIKESDQKIPGSLLVVIPTRQVIERNGVVTTGSTTPDQVSYVVDVLEMGFLGVTEAIRQTRAFNRVVVIRSANTETEPISTYDFKLWLLSTPARDWQWYLSRKDGSREPLHFDRGVSGPARSIAFNSSIIRAANAGESSAAVVAQPRSNTTPSKKSSSGTAFFINSSGFAITNAHVVNGCSSARAIIPNNGSISALVVAADAINDLALVKLNIRASSHAQFRLSPTIRQGEHVTVYGYPLAGALASQGNLSTGIVSALAGLGNDTRELQISAPVQPGNSGGPVLDDAGNVIGVVTSKLNALTTARVTGDIPQNVNFAVKSGIAIGFLEANGVDHQRSSARKTLSVADVGDKAKDFTFAIECTQ